MTIIIHVDANGVPILNNVLQNNIIMSPFTPRPLSYAQISFSNIKLPLYSDAQCTIEGNTLSNLTVNQENIIERYIKNPTPQQMAVNISDANAETTYSLDNVTYSDPTEYFLLQPNEIRKLYIKVTPTAETTYTLTCNVRQAVI